MYQSNAVRQAVIADRTARLIYNTRRQALLDALAVHNITAHGVSGLNVWIPVKQEALVAQSLFARSWAVRTSEMFRVGRMSALRVTTATLQPEDAKTFASDLAFCLSPSQRTQGA